MEDRDLKLKQQRAKRRKNELIMKYIISVLILAIIFLTVILIKDALIPGMKNDKKDIREKHAALIQEETELSDEQLANEPKGTEADLIAQADRMAQQYDYAGAIAYLQSSSLYTSKTAPSR